MEPLRTLEVVWGNGEKLFTGNGHLRGEKDSDWEGGLVPLWPAAPASWTSSASSPAPRAPWGSRRGLRQVRAHPDASTLLAITADRLEDLVPCAYELAKIRFGDELFLLNATAMSLLLEGDPGARALLTAPWPAGCSWWASAAGPSRAPSSWRGARRTSANRDTPRAKRPRRPPRASRSGLLARLQAPSPEPYWRDRPGTGSEEVFFLTTLDRVPDFLAATEAAAAAGPAPVPDIGIYLQPIHQGAGLHCELILPFDRAVPAPRRPSAS